MGEGLLGKGGGTAHGSAFSRIRSILARSSFDEMNPSTEGCIWSMEGTTARERCEIGAVCERRSGGVKIILVVISTPRP